MGFWLRKGKMPSGTLIRFDKDIWKSPIIHNFSHGVILEHEKPAVISLTVYPPPGKGHVYNTKILPEDFVYDMQGYTVAFSLVSLPEGQDMLKWDWEP
jgi:hypothetical protein